jgi:peptide/nickel transport system permease protein
MALLSREGPAPTQGELPVKRYLLIRFGQLIVIAFLISVLTFLLVHLLPGNPADTILGPNQTPANRAALFKQLGLNKPLLQQYFTWLKNVIRGNLGESFLNHENVTTTIANAFPVDLELIIFSQVIAFAIAIPLALVASRRPNSIFDRLASISTFGMLAMPAFVIGPILALVFAVKIHWFPATGAPSLTSAFATNLHDMVLPSIALAFGSIAVYFRLLRGDLISTLQEDYITMARSKGLSTSYIMTRHALRPSSFSMLASAGLNIGSLITGAFVIEYLFGLNGIGAQLVISINSRDYLEVQGIALVVAVVYVLVNFFVNFLYTVLDPRIARA